MLKFNLKKTFNREFNDKQLELLEGKEQKLEKLRADIEIEVNRKNEVEKKRLIDEHELKIK